MKVKLLLPLLPVLFLLSCQKDKSGIPISEIVFGIVGSNCGGDCRELYLLTSAAIYADNGEASGLELPWNETVFEPTPLPAEKFELAIGLLDLPDELRIGNPDPGYFEQGFFPNRYLEIRQTKKTWVFQALSPDAPQDIKDYFSEMARVLQELRR